MVTEKQQKLYFVPCKKVTILSAVASSYAEAVEKILVEHPLVVEYKSEDDNFIEWVKADDKSLHFEHVDTDTFTTEDFTADFIGELASLVGVDAIGEFGRLLEEKRPDLYDPFVESVLRYFIEQDLKLVEE